MLVMVASTISTLPDAVSLASFLARGKELQPHKPVCLRRAGGCLPSYVCYLNHFEFYCPPNHDPMKNHVIVKQLSNKRYLIYK